MPYVPSGAAFTARPAAMRLYYQLFTRPGLAGADSAFTAVVDVKLTRWVNGKRKVIAQARQNVTKRTRAYKLFSAPLQYLSAATPDSVQIIFALDHKPTLDPKSGRTKANTGTIWRVDDISFTGAAAGSAAPAQPAAALAATLSVFPNPSDDGRYELSATEPALLAVPLVVLDAHGLVVRRESALQSVPAGSRTLDLSGLPRGLYTVQFFTPSGLVTRRLSRQ